MRGCASWQVPGMRWPPRWRSGSLLLALAAAGCTPLGLWIYQDPAVHVAEVTVDQAISAEYPVRIGLAISNANDFEVSLLRVQLQLTVGGRTLMQREVATTAVFLPRDQMTVTIGIMPGDLIPGARRGVTPTQRYLLDGYATLKTPLGERRIAFQQSGTGLGATPAFPG